MAPRDSQICEPRKEWFFLLFSIKNYQEPYHISLDISRIKKYFRLSETAIKILEQEFPLPVALMSKMVHNELFNRCRAAIDQYAPTQFKHCDKVISPGPNASNNAF